MERRSLKVGMNTIPNADPEEVRRFVTSDSQLEVSPEVENRPQGMSPARRSIVGRGRTKPTGVTPVGLIPITVRLRPETAGALKRASLERQLAGEPVFTQQELVEEALEPWLRANG